jgi:hypothetical protein
MNAEGGPCGPRQTWPEPTAPDPDFGAGNYSAFTLLPLAD